MKKRKGPRPLKKLNLSDDELHEIRRFSASRSMPAVEVRRARILLAHHEGESTASIARSESIDRSVIDRLIDKALCYGAVESLKDLPRSGRKREITDDAIQWVLSIACDKPSSYGYPHEVWTYALIISTVKANCVAKGYDCLKNIGKSVLHSILSKSDIKPHKVSYYLEKRDPDFEAKMADVLCVYKEVQGLNEENLTGQNEVTVSVDEKPGIQAIKNIAPQLQPVPGKHQCITRDYEYKRLGTVSLIAGIDLHTGKVVHIVRDRHRSCEFIELLKRLEEEYPADWTIRLVLDNHSSHISKETRAFLKTRQNKFKFVFTPKHGSWLNMIECFFSKISRTILRHIRVDSKDELIQRIDEGIAYVNDNPVVFKWKYKMDEVKQ